MKFKLAREKNGVLIKYFGIPALVSGDDLKSKTSIKISKVISILYLNNLDYIRSSLNIKDTEISKNAKFIPVIVVDTRSLKDSIFNDTEKAKIIIAYYSAMAREKIDPYYFSELNNMLESKGYSNMDENEIQGSEMDNNAILLIATALETNAKIKTISKLIFKNEKKSVPYLEKQVQILKKDYSKFSYFQTQDNA